MSPARIRIFAIAIDALLPDRMSCHPTRSTRSNPSIVPLAGCSHLETVGALPVAAAHTGAIAASRRAHTVAPTLDARAGTSASSVAQEAA